MLFNLISIVVVLVLLIFSISKLKIHPFIVLILAAIALGLLVGLDGVETINVLLEGFGSTMKWIAIVVILGAFIGEVLNETGGAIRIAQKILKWVGQKRLPWAMGLTGYIVSIPVFVDVAYILFQPITEGLAKRSKTPLLVVGLSLAAGLTVSHTLMPPTPGPLAVAAILKADLGKLLLINSFIAIFVVTGGVLWAKLFCKKFLLDFDKTSSSDLKDTIETTTFEAKKTSILLDLLPIIVPIVLMGAGAFFKSDDHFGNAIAFLSIPMVAVLIGSAIAAVQFFQIKTKSSLNDLVEAAIVKSALVIMITGAGGAFGYVIRESGVQDSLGDFFTSLPYLGFILPFIVAAVLTTATGSITVSLIGAASILSPMTGIMPYSPELMAALIGSGAFCVFHANSSFFWLLNRLHNIPVSTLYKTFTPQSLVMGISGLLGVVILYVLGLY
ncbi:GntP family permease [Algibacter mikhailovii]|uniref:GntP family permease n=1 Tax=Algibacter mikhailovii TaxID=425498 RepID=UPI002494715D|nr:GntP family permease [Algibacter mikhailovii]